MRYRRKSGSNWGWYYFLSEKNNPIKNKWQNFCDYYKDITFIVKIIAE